jgi:hypothetical protein
MFINYYKKMIYIIYIIIMDIYFIMMDIDIIKYDYEINIVK